MNVFFFYDWVIEGFYDYVLDVVLQQCFIKWFQVIGQGDVIGSCELVYYVIGIVVVVEVVDDVDLEMIIVCDVGQLSDVGIFVYQQVVFVVEVLGEGGEFVVFWIGNVGQVEIECF